MVGIWSPGRRRKDFVRQLAFCKHIDTKNEDVLVRTETRVGNGVATIIPLSAF